MFCCYTQVTLSLRYVYQSRLLVATDYVNQNKMQLLFFSFFSHQLFVERPVSANTALMFLCCRALSRVHTADYYMQEAKRLKHKADALVRPSTTLSARSPPAHTRRRLKGAHNTLKNDENTHTVSSLDCSCVLSLRR